MSYYEDFEAQYEIYEKWTKGAKMERAKKGHDEKCPVCDRTLIDGDGCDNHGRVNERPNPNDYR